MEETRNNVDKSMNGLVYINNSQALTTSITVAKKFGKEHYDVLKAIRNLTVTKSENSLFVDNQQLAKMFALTEVEQLMPVGGGVKKTPMYVMNRDGFTLLAMGFTGEKALHFKLEYINAFNEMERKIRESAGSYNLPDFANPAEAARAWAEQYEKTLALKAKVEQDAPKVEFFDAVAESKTAIEMKAVANTLHFKGVGRNKLFDILRTAKILMPNNMPYQRYVDGGLFRTVEQKFSTPDGEVRVSIKTLVYQKGVDYIRKTLKTLGYREAE